MVSKGVLSFHFISKKAPWGVHLCLGGMAKENNSWWGSCAQNYTFTYDKCPSMVPYDKPPPYWGRNKTFSLFSENKHSSKQKNTKRAQSLKGHKGARSCCPEESWPKTQARRPYINVYEGFAPRNLEGDQWSEAVEKQQWSALMQCHLIQLNQ